MAVDFSTMEQNTTTGATKKKQLPYLNDGQQQNILPVVYPDTTAQGNTAVMQRAQQASLQPQNQQLTQQASQMTQKMMTDPNFGFDAQKYNTGQLSTFDANRAAANQALRQQTADVAGSGALQENLIKTLLAQNTDRSQLENQLNREAYDITKQNWIDAINQGLIQQRAESDLNTQAINNLLNVRGAYEPERSQTQTQQNAIDLSKLGQGQTLEQMQQAQQNAIELAKLGQGQTLEQMQQAQQNAIELAKIGQSQTLEQMAQAQEYNVDNMTQSQKNTLEQMAAANGMDLARMDKQQINDLAKMAAAQGYNMQTIDATQMNDLEKMAMAQGYTLATMSEEQKNNLATMAAAAGYDMDRINAAQENAKELESLGHKNAMEKLSTQYGYEEAARYSEQQFEKAMSTQDFTQARTIQQDRLTFEADQAIADRALTQSKIDIDTLANEYAMLKDAVSSGQASPADLIGFLNDAGIDVTAVDTAKATREALDAEYSAQEYQFAKTHPDLVDPVNQELTEEGKQQFLDFFNKSVFGEGTVNDYINGIVDAKQLTTEPDALAEVYETSPDWSPDVSRDGRGFWNPDVRTINNAPAEGTYFKHNGALYYSTSGVSEETKGQNYQYFTALDVANGTTVKIRANEDANGIEGI